MSMYKKTLSPRSYIFTETKKPDLTEAFITARIKVQNPLNGRRENFACVVSCKLKVAIKGDHISGE